MYKLETETKIDEIFKKLKKKNPKQLEIIFKKAKQILENLTHFKPLRGDMKGARRVHIDKSFVLIYEIDEKNKLIRLLDYDHHNNIY
ncbi:MAG: type II toxin-antitoxin system mRNA interferase toxin, RelE/StbE family [Nanoarchaeota archaeon]|nr:type II toxin-antitoxin system mRNA interferase toxin, RelE/StbE family [Nanoarchaeota archaeon]MBU1321714.1 type II toxin-antitoxin system mRNA interferase toxin, RelE/StbE family [Nanoarchaeota archaeon]MBU1597680.1 type II toxin-antitoxin system mRNA interferase toxin, RelE/StbE family [Nanoarchaeota archaeon]MBU2441020.1 type II toxin-antitoxin system mRNA interferase toxin, RelE/StbE family [Nanoarchaeota archaeon]